MSLFTTSEKRSVLRERGVRWKNWSKRCASPECLTSGFKSIFQGEGIQLGDDWHCSLNCLEAALYGRFAEFARAAHPVEPPRPARFPLGLMLFSRGYLNAEQFKVALDEHRASGARIGDVALQHGFVNEEQVAAALAAQWGYPVLPSKSIPAQLPLLAPVHLMELHQMLPIQFMEDGRKLLLGFAMRVDYSAIHGIEQMFSCVADPCFVTMSEYRARIQALPSRRNEVEFRMDQVLPPREMAEIAASHIAAIQADRIRFAICREYLWTRVSGPEQERDLLFRLEVG